ncbi:ABC transporter substrate-binding protein [Cryobacterium sp. PH31-L1]|uniref:ABC transporter substrate-binding protein n=1 Tax=Cryobacterium sp. PH31-L1 TaxID=3046199 RepID=UPI0032D939DE
MSTSAPSPLDPNSPGTARSALAAASGQFFSRRHVLGGGMAIGVGALLTACGGTAVAQLPALTGPPQRGGILRVGLVGGGAADTLDAHIPVSTTDIARVVNLYEALLYRDENFDLKPLLALSATPSLDSKTWTVRLRQGVTFHNGHLMTSRDVAATFARIMDPENPKSGASSLTILDEVVVLDDYLLEFRLNTPTATFDDSLGQYSLGIVPKDYDPLHPIGTGPFRYDSFTAGRRSVFTRNDNYWQDNEPHLDELRILNFSDDNALINALLATQVDAIGQVPLALLEVLETDPRVDILNSETGMWLPFTMRVDRAPFDDVRVRQAFRLVVDREEMVEQVLSGHGTVGNDMYALYDPGYAENLPQRVQDIDRAKELLAEAGYPDGLDVELVTAPIQAGAVEAAQVFAQQALAAGINVTIRRVDTTTFFGDDYLQWDFSQDFWYTRNFLPQVDNGSLPTSPYNETHWDNPRFIELVNEAKSTIDPTRRNELITEAQTIEYEEGGHIIWGHPNQADAYQRYVGGLVPTGTGLPLSGFEFRRVWMGGQN